MTIEIIDRLGYLSFYGVSAYKQTVKKKKKSILKVDLEVNDSIDGTSTEVDILV